MPSKTILSMLRIYIANFLMSENGIESFTKESIDCLAIYIYKCMHLLNYSHGNANAQDEENTR